jgi:hypothetical protein
MKRHVFDKLNTHPAVKPFNNDIGLPVELNPHMKTYFDTAVRENRYYSEDWTFCENWRDIGGKVWVDKRVLLRHTGTYVFDYAAQDRLYQDLHAMATANTQIVDHGAPTTAVPFVASKGVSEAAAPINIKPADAPAPVKAKVMKSSKKAKTA